MCDAGRDVWSIWNADSDSMQTNVSYPCPAPFEYAFNFSLHAFEQSHKTVYIAKHMYIHRCIYTICICIVSQVISSRISGCSEVSRLENHTRLKSSKTCPATMKYNEFLYAHDKNMLNLTQILDCPWNLSEFLACDRPRVMRF